MYVNNNPPTTPKQGFLQEEFHLFHIKDEVQRAYKSHYHDFLEIVVLLEGDATYTIGRRSHSLHPGSIVLVDHGQIRCPQADASSPYKRLILYLSPDFLDRCREGVSSLDSCFSTAAYRHSNVLRLKDEAYYLAISLLKKLEYAQDWQEEEFIGLLYCRLLYLQLLVELNRVPLDDNAQYPPNGALNYRMSGLISYTNKHLCEDLSIRNLSTLNCVSPYRMTRIFKEETRYTVGNYITKKHLLKAYSLLAEGTGATQVCYLSGFSNYSTFLRAYKQHLGELLKRSAYAKKT